MEIATTIAKNRRDSVIGVKRLLLKQMTMDLEEQWAAEKTIRPTCPRARGQRKPSPSSSRGGGSRCQTPQ